VKKYVITLRESPDRESACRKHLGDVGFDGVEYFYGVNAAKWGLHTTHPYEIDHPGTGYITPPKHVGLHLSHWILWQLALRSDEDITSIMEDDVAMAGDWQPRLSTILTAAPDDWDIILLGHCNALNKPTTHVRGQLFDVRYPQCTHWYIARKKAIPFLLESQEKAWAPIDLALIFNSYPHLKVLTAIPRLAAQSTIDLAE
jgi:GR25 family glycosyltransferase involved in LPS biosynthesis